MTVHSNNMVDNVTLKKIARGRGFTNAALADYLDISIPTLKLRFRFGNWSVAEAYKLHVLLGVGDEVFFAFPERLDWKR